MADLWDRYYKKDVDLVNPRTLFSKNDQNYVVTRLHFSIVWPIGHVRIAASTIQVHIEYCNIQYFSVFIFNHKTHSICFS